MDLTPTRIRVHIEELVLHGFAPGDRLRIADALQAGLADLLAVRGLSVPPARDTTVARLDAGTIRISPGAGAGAIGGQLARALHRGLDPGGRP
jgi:hypothetical protein